MLFRALFWIGVVVLFMPGAGGSVVGSRAQAKTGYAESAAAASGTFREFIFERLATVKRDIETAERSRSHSGR